MCPLPLEAVGTGPSTSVQDCGVCVKRSICMMSTAAFLRRWAREVLLDQYPTSWSLYQGGHQTRKSRRLLKKAHYRLFITTNVPRNNTNFHLQIDNSQQVGGEKAIENMCFPGGSDSKESACDAGDLGSIPGWARSPGEGNGYPLQCAGLENSMDRGAWQVTVRGVAKSQTWLGDQHFQKFMWSDSLRPWYTLRCLKDILLKFTVVISGWVCFRWLLLSTFFFLF